MYKMPSLLSLFLLGKCFWMSYWWYVGQDPNKLFVASVVVVWELEQVASEQSSNPMTRSDGSCMFGCKPRLFLVKVDTPSFFTMMCSSTSEFQDM